MGLEIIAKLTEGSSGDYTIKKLSGNKGSEMIDNTIYWNQADGWVMGANDKLLSTPIFISLGHELGHAFLLEKGVPNKGVWIRDLEGKPISPHEIPATQIENKIRRELNYDRRTWYYFKRRQNILGLHNMTKGVKSLKEDMRNEAPVYFRFIHTCSLSKEL